MTLNKTVRLAARVSTRLSVVRLTVAAGLVLSLASSASATSLLDNGSFSLGQTGFASGYLYDDDCWAEGTYFLAGAGSDCHPLWADFGDHTTGDGTMMVVNGAATSGVEVWSAEVEVTPDTDYTFSGWLATLYPRSPGSLELTINGVSMAIAIDAPDATGTWESFSSTWHSGSSSFARLVLVNHNLEWAGNDFALDDLAFAQPAKDLIENPEPQSLMLLGLGLGAAVLLGRRRRGSR